MCNPSRKASTSTSSVPRFSSRPTMRPSWRATSSKSTMTYPRLANTSHAEVFPVPGVPVIATSTGRTNESRDKSLAMPVSTRPEEIGGSESESFTNQEANHPEDAVKRDDEQVQRDGQADDEREDVVGSDFEKPGGNRGDREGERDDHSNRERQERLDHARCRSSVGRPPRTAARSRSPRSMGNDASSEAGTLTFGKTR